MTQLRDLLCFVLLFLDCECFKKVHLSINDRNGDIFLFFWKALDSCSSIKAFFGNMAMRHKKHNHIEIHEKMHEESENKDVTV